MAAAGGSFGGWDVSRQIDVVLGFRFARHACFGITGLAPDPHSADLYKALPISQMRLFGLWASPTRRVLA